MSVSLNETTNIAWFYGGRTESTEQTSDYVNKNNPKNNQIINRFISLIHFTISIYKHLHGIGPIPTILGVIDLQDMAIVAI
jgi:hypothetical protein